VVRVFEDAKGLDPGGERGGAVAVDLVAIAKVVEDGGLQSGVPVGHSQGLPVPGDG